MPDGIVQLFARRSTGDFDAFNALLLIMIVFGTIAVICFFERGHRRIPVQYTKRMVGRKMYGGTQTHLPLKINMAGVIPPIFASSIMLFPAQIANMVGSPWLQEVSNALQPNDWRYQSLYVLMIVFFTYFYTAVTFNVADVSDNLKKYGSFIPGIRPGRPTERYLDRVLSRITVAGALFLGTIALLSYYVPVITGVTSFSVVGGTSLLILVGVALDTMQQIEAHLVMRQYEGFIK